MTELNKIQAFKEKLAALPQNERQALLAQLEKRLMKETATQKNQSTEPHPLTSAQKRLWVLEQFNREKYLYHVPFILTLPSNINLEKLQVAIHKLVKKHPQLTSYFVANEEDVLQHYAEDPSIHLLHINLHQELNEVVKVDSDQQLSAFFLQPFNLNEPSLFRVAIAKANETHYLFICCHHLIMDAWSASLLLANLGELYHQIETHPSESYRDYVSLERKQLENNLYSVELNYWGNRLKNLQWNIDLITDYPRRKNLTGVGDNYLVSVPHEIFQLLTEYAKKNQVSINHLVLALFQLLLSRYSNQDTITLGIPIAGRYQESHQKTIGLFVNTCIHTSQIDYQNNFKTHLLKTKMQLVQDMSYAKVPYDQVMKHLYHTQSCQQGTSFNVLYNFIQTENQHTLYFDSLPAKVNLCLLPISKFDMSLHVLMSHPTLNLLLEYSTELFCEATIQQMLNDLLNYLKVFIENDQQPLGELIWSMTDNN